MGLLTESEIISILLLGSMIFFNICVDIGQSIPTYTHVRPISDTPLFIYIFLQNLLFILSFFLSPPLSIFISNSTALRQKFFNYSGCTIRDKHTLIVCGGIDSTLRNISNQVFEYDFRTNDMRMLRPMNQIRYTFPIIYHDNYIYAVGGRIYGPDNRSPFISYIQGVLSIYICFNQISQEWSK